MPHHRFKDEDDEEGENECEMEQAGNDHSMMNDGFTKTQNLNSGNSSMAENCGAAKTLRAVKVIQTSFGNFSDPDYVFDIASNGDASAMAVSLSTNRIKLYSVMNGDFLGDILGHTDTITDISFPQSLNSNILLSSSSDSTVRFWDIRTRTQVGQFNENKQDEFWCVTVANNILSAGSNSKIYLWDIRTNNLLACLEDSHTEAVTQVKFHDNYSSKLFSASVDGLVCVNDISKELNEEECMDNVMCVGTSIAKIGFYGQDCNFLWVLTHTEDLSLWSIMGDRIMQFPNTRSLASQQSQFGNIDYLTKCEYDSSSGALYLVCGSNSGTFGSFSVQNPQGTGTETASPCTVGHCASIFKGGHASVVRALLPLKGEHAFTEGGDVVCWSGGEDGRLCAWSGGDSGLVNYGHAFRGDRVILSSSAHDKGHGNLRFKPY